MTHIDITETDRGFHIYGEPVMTTYGHPVRVYESSAASGPHCWLDVGKSAQTEGRTAHLSLEQAVAIRDRLNAFIYEVPERWNSNPDTAEWWRTVIHWADEATEEPPDESTEDDGGIG